MKKNENGAAHPTETHSVFGGEMGLRVFDGMVDGCAVHEIVYENDEPVDYRFLAINKAYAETTGFRPTEVVGRTLREVMPFVEIRWLERYERVVRTGAPERFEHYSKEFGKHFVVSVFPIGGSCFAATFTDVSERASASQALAESQSRLSSIFRAAPIGVGLTLNRVIQEVNDRVCEISGYSRDELLGQSSRMVYASDEECERVGREKYAAIAETGFGAIESQWQRKDGTMVDVILQSSPLSGNDISQGVTFTVWDITEQKRVMRQREELERQLVQAQKLEAIGTLAAGIAHDFNNILSAVTGFAELAKGEVEPGSEVSGDLDEVLSAGERARELVGQILAFARQDEAGGRRAVVELPPIVREAGRLLRRSIPTSIDFEIRIGNGCSSVLAEGTRIHQIVVNLVTNAYHALIDRQDVGDQGHIVLALDDVDVNSSSFGTLSTLKPGRYARISVRDNGVGMSPTTVQRIFEPYFTTKRPGQGTGLGLSIVHGIVISHGGEITVKSRLGEGTAFFVYLPCAESVQESQTRVRDEADRLRGNERILFVDDDDSILRLASRSLRKLGYEVTTQRNGVRALETFKASPDSFDIVVTDPMMPHMTGTQLGQALLRIRPELPVILCTGFDGNLSPGEVVGLGIRSVAQKPIVGTELAALVRKTFDNDLS